MSFIKPWQYTAIMGAILSFPTYSIAQNISKLDNIVVTPSRTAQLESEVVGDISVVSNTELEQAGQSSLAEILSKQPGVQIYTNGGPQTATGVYLRGTNPNQTLVMVDGVRINSATQGTVNWNTINSALVDHIEIVRGGASALYGADAVGGVINIITKNATSGKPFSAWGNIGYGSYNTFKADAGIAGNHNGWDYAVGAFKQDSDGFNATNKDNTLSYNNDLDGYESQGLNASLGYTFIPGHRLSLIAYNSYINGDFDAGENSTAYTISRQQVYSLKSENKFNDFWHSQIRFDFSKEYIDSRNKSIFPWEDWESKYSSIQRNLSWQNDFHINEHHTISAILERREDRINHSDNYTNDSRNTNSIGLSYLGNFNGFRTQASIRNDKFSDYKSKRTGSLGFDFDVTDTISLGALASTSFRMPTFSDMYYPLNWGFQGNPNLKPESSKSFEVSAKYRDDNLGLSVTAYRNNIKDMINSSTCVDWNEVLGLCELSQPINVDKALIKGITLAADYQIGNTNLNASADFLSPKDRKTGKVLVRRAKQVYNLGVNHQIHNWNLGAEYQFVGKRYNDADNKITLGGYGLANLTAQYDFNKNISIQARWNNVFNKKYHNVYGYNNPGSNVFFNLSFKM